MIVPLEDIKFVFNESLMQLGDILLVNTYDSQRNRMPGCKYDHAAIYLGDAFLIEADGYGVVMNHIYSYAFKEAEHGCVLRPKVFNHRMSEEVVYWARGRMAMEFGALQARKVINFRDTEERDKSNRTFCSRLVAQAYHQAGIDIVRNPDFCSPDDIFGSDVLKVVEPSLLLFTDEMTMTVMNGQKDRNKSEWSTVLPDMFIALGHLYDEDIQTMDQLFVAAVKNTDMDDKVLEVLSKQKWMTHPEKQTEMQWPWFNDDEKFFAHFSTTKDVMFFLNNQFLHYDKTYLPIFRENAMNTYLGSKLRKDSKVIKALADQFKAVLDEGIRVRKRLADLYLDTFTRDTKGFLAFCEKYGHNSKFEYQEGIIDLSRTIKALIEYGPVNLGDYLKD